MRRAAKAPGDRPGLPCACASLRRADRAVTQLYETCLRPTGLRVTQFTLLQVLGRAGPLTQARISGSLAIDTTTLTRTLRPLESRGWIEASPGDDRREWYWALTARGRRKLEEALPRWRRAQERLRASLGDGEWTRLLRTLRAVARSVGTV